ncbi:helix-turn-helix domain-containing protein [Celeribacter sp.]|uniref:helix-turn-helix domain-containing protein n=1 Tax=Celeribacter sp. TaxID=1890673 RepID=UPI003A9572DA
MTMRSITENSLAGGQVGPTPLVYLLNDDPYGRDNLVQLLRQCGVPVMGFENIFSLEKAFETNAAEILLMDVTFIEKHQLRTFLQLGHSRKVGTIIVSASPQVEEFLDQFAIPKNTDGVLPIVVKDRATLLFELGHAVGSYSEMKVVKPVVSWALEEGGWVLSDGNGNRLKLTALEQSFLTHLFDSRGEIVERGKLIEAMGEDIYDFSYTYLDTLVSRLRRRARRENMYLPLHTVRGVGFTFSG